MRVLKRHDISGKLVLKHATEFVYLFVYLFVCCLRRFYINHRASSVRFQSFPTTNWKHPRDHRKSLLGLKSAARKGWFQPWIAARRPKDANNRQVSARRTEETRKSEAKVKYQSLCLRGVTESKVSHCHWQVLRKWWFRKQQALLACSFCRKLPIAGAIFQFSYNFARASLRFGFEVYNKLEMVATKQKR